MAENKKKPNSKKIIVICNVFMTVFFIICVGALLYPYISNEYNNRNQEDHIFTYDRIVSEMDQDKTQMLLAEANAYNQNLLYNPTGFFLNEAQMAEYNSVLDMNDSGVIGHIEIPHINVSLMIYHSVDEAVLQTGVGHLPGSSFPVGGIGTHSVLTGHRGLTSATLFSDLDKMKVGDEFFIHVLGMILTYQVDDIRDVYPHEMDTLKIDPTKDLCTLVTCTPYGVNSQRMLVRGHRVDPPTTAEIREVNGVHQVVAISPETETSQLAVVLAVIGVLMVIGAISALCVRAIKK